jgi:opacity protein-like surface antigen
VRTVLTSAVAAAVLLACVPAASAQQAGSATASAPPGVLYLDCVDHAANYAVSVDPPETDWFLALEVHRADGGYVAGNYRGKQFGHPTTGTVGLQMCGRSEDPGTFTLTGRLQYGLTNSTPVAPTTFTLRNPFTNTAIKPSIKNPAKGQEVAIKIKSRDEMPGGYERKAGAAVLLQQKTERGWSKVKGSKAETNEKGKAKVKVRYTGGKLKLRAVTKGSADWDRSHSRKVVLR